MRRTIELLLAGVALSMIALFLFVALRRIGYPFELEWMEGGVVDHAARILDGKQLYEKPSIEFIAYTYTPLYFYVSALSARLLGIGFLAVRLVSLVATLGCLTLVFQFVRRESRSAFFGLLAAGLFAACYSITGFWYDLARPDMLFLALLLGSAYLLRFREETRYLVIAGLLAALAFMAKQTTLFIALPLVSYSLATLPGWKKTIFPATFAGVAGAASLAFMAATGGWYYFYVFQLPRYHAIISKNYDDFPQFIYRLTVASAFALLFLGILAFRRHYRPLAFYGLFLAGMVFASWSVSIREGSFANVMIPAATAISICFGLGARELAAIDAARPRSGTRGNRRTAVILIPLAVYLLSAWQLATLYYDPRDQMPTEASRRAGEELVMQLEHIEGDVFVPFHGFLAAQAGKSSSAQGVAIGDLIQTGLPEALELQRSIGAAFRDRRYSALVIDGPLDADLAGWLGLDGETAAALACRELEYDGAYTFYPVTGMMTRPESICEFP